MCVVAWVLYDRFLVCVCACKPVRVYICGAKAAAILNIAGQDALNDSNHDVTLLRNLITENA